MSTLKAIFTLSAICSFAYANDVAVSGATDSLIKTDENSLSLIKTTKDNFQAINIQPNTDSVYTTYEYLKQQGYRVDLGVYYETIDKQEDTIFELSYRFLYAGSKLGMYIGVENSPKFQNFVISHGFKPKYGKLKITAGLLKKISELYLSDYDLSHRDIAEQKAVAAEYSYRNENKSIIKELIASVSYYDINGQKLGNFADVAIKNNIIEDWQTDYGKYISANKFYAELTSVFKISKNIKAEAGIGYEKLEYALLHGSQEEKKGYIPSFLAVTFKTSKTNKLKIYAKNKRRKTFGLKNSKIFSKRLKGYMELERRFEDGLNETMCRFGLEYSFGYDGRNSLSPLFEAKKTKKNLTLDDLAPNKDIKNHDFAISN